MFGALSLVAQFVEFSEEAVCPSRARYPAMFCPRRSRVLLASVWDLRSAGSSMMMINYYDVKVMSSDTKVTPAKGEKQPIGK